MRKKKNTHITYMKIFCASSTNTQIIFKSFKKPIVYCCMLLIVLTFGTPTLDYRVDKLVESSTNVRCNGNGMHAMRKKMSKN